MVTYERLRSLFVYYPATGVFVRIKKNSINTEVGEIAGTIHKSSGRMMLKIDGRQNNASRLAFLYMTGKSPSEFIDHVNCDILDNSWENLREATRSQNGANAMIHKNNKVGLKGVSLCYGKYRAQIKSGGKVKYLGLYSSPEEAYLAYVNAAVEHHGEFARG